MKLGVKETESPPAGPPAGSDPIRVVCLDLLYSSGYFVIMELVIQVEYDDEARVWVAQSDEIGLATEADTMEVLTYKLKEMIPELVELNNIELPRPVPFTLVSRRPMTAFA